MVDTPLYQHSLRDARELGQLDKWRVSFRANIACREAIEAAIREGFDGMYLNGDCAQNVIEEYGFLRTRYVLANSLQHREGDGRFSRDNRAWSEAVYIPENSNNGQFAVNSHSAILDRFVNQFRKAYQALNLFGSEQCVDNALQESFQDRVLVMKPSAMKERYWDQRFQLWHGESGFGLDPDKTGTAVYATCLGDGEHARWSRSDFLGPIREACMPDWAREQFARLKSGQSLRQPEQEMTR